MLFESVLSMTAEQGMVIGICVGWVIGLACMKLLIDIKRDIKRGDKNDPEDHGDETRSKNQ